MFTRMGFIVFSGVVDEQYSCCFVPLSRQKCNAIPARTTQLGFSSRLSIFSFHLISFEILSLLYLHFLYALQFGALVYGWY